MSNKKDIKREDLVYINGGGGTVYNDGSSNPSDQYQPDLLGVPKPIRTEQGGVNNTETDKGGPLV